MVNFLSLGFSERDSVMLETFVFIAPKNKDGSK